jgi:hypothetical protein
MAELDPSNNPETVDLSTPNQVEPSTPPVDSSSPLVPEEPVVPKRPTTEPQQENDIKNIQDNPVLGTDEAKAQAIAEALVKRSERNSLPATTPYQHILNAYIDILTEKVDGKLLSGPSIKKVHNALLEMAFQAGIQEAVLFTNTPQKYDFSTNPLNSYPDAFRAFAGLPADNDQNTYKSIGDITNNKLVADGISNIQGAFLNGAFHYTVGRSFAANQLELQYQFSNLAPIRPPFQSFVPPQTVPVPEDTEGRRRHHGDWQPNHRDRRPSPSDWRLPVDDYKDWRSPIDKDHNRRGNGNEPSGRPPKPHYPHRGGGSGH